MQQGEAGATEAAGGEAGATRVTGVAAGDTGQKFSCGPRVRGVVVWPSHETPQEDLLDRNTPIMTSVFSSRHSTTCPS